MPQSQAKELSRPSPRPIAHPLASAQKSLASVQHFSDIAAARIDRTAPNLPTAPAAWMPVARTNATSNSQGGFLPSLRRLAMPEGFVRDREIRVSSLDRKSSNIGDAFVLLKPATTQPRSKPWAARPRCSETNTDRQGPKRPRQGNRRAWRSAAKRPEHELKMPPRIAEEVDRPADANSR
jgi:hypothetical protein